MPTYDYKCKKCGMIIEDRRSYEDRDKIAPCENCTGNCKRIVSGIALGRMHKGSSY